MHNLPGPQSRFRTVALGLVGVGALVASACAGPGPTVVVRGVDEVQVMAQQDVARARPVLTPLTATSTVALDGEVAGEESAASTIATSTTTTVPLVVDDRPPEVRLFAAFGEFRSCLSDRGYAVEGNLLDRNNPAFQDPAYVLAVQTCAARTDIVTVLQEVQTTRSSLTPEEVATRNEVLVALSDCLEARGWTVETRKNEIGLLEPEVFQDAAGALNERDISQCLAEQNLG